MGLERFQPVEHFGIKFDRGCVLYEFSALREPERTRFPQIGAWLRERHEFNQVPMPQMYWRGQFWPDLYIANQLDAAFGYFPKGVTGRELPPKSTWSDDLTLEVVSCWQHGAQFHDEFIDHMCWKIAGRPSSDIAAKYHRSIWLPIYHAETLRARASIPTAFWYPKAGYAGAGLPAVRQGVLGVPVENDRARRETVGISIAYVLGQSSTPFSVLFVVDDFTPIYRITDMDVCAGLNPQWHRFVVEFRGEKHIVPHLLRLGITVDAIAFGEARIVLPTIENVRAGHDFSRNLNSQLWEIYSASR